MAPKQPEKIENPPMASSSEEEESGSTEYESNSSGEESDSSDEESEPVVESKKESLTKPTEASVVSKSSGLKTATKPSDVVTPSLKRPLEKTEAVSNKKVKESSSKEVKNDEKPKQNLFARKFSEKDEVVLLQAIIDFTATSGNPSEHMDAFCEYVKKSISFDATKDQLVTKLRNLRRKFEEKILKSLEKGLTKEDEIVFLKAFDKRCFDLSRKIWGTDGILPSKAKKMRQGQLEQLEGSCKDEEDEKLERRVISTPLSSGQELVSFIRVENPTCLGIDEAAWIASWDKVKDGPKKRELEEKLKKLKAMQEELCMSRIGFVNDVATAIFKQDKASSSGK